MGASPRRGLSPVHPASIPAYGDILTRVTLMTYLRLSIACVTCVVVLACIADSQDVADSERLNDAPVPRECAPHKALAFTTIIFTTWILMSYCK